MFLYGFLQGFLFFCRRVHAIGQAAVIKGNGRVLHGSADFERNRFVFWLQYIADKQVFGQLLGIQIGIAAADNVQAVGKQFGVDMMADAFLNFAIEGEMMERGFEVAVVDFFRRDAVFQNAVHIDAVPCAVGNIEEQAAV